MVAKDSGVQPVFQSTHDPRTSDTQYGVREGRTCRGAAPAEVSRGQFTADTSTKCSRWSSMRGMVSPETSPPSSMMRFVSAAPGRPIVM
jgi:hypothetical protein